MAAVSKLNDLGSILLPFLERPFRARHPRQHDTDRKDELKVSPNDVHMVADDLVFRHVSHENRHSLAHANSPDQTIRQENEATAILASGLSDSRFTELTATPAQSLTPRLRNLALGLSVPPMGRAPFSVTP